MSKEQLTTSRESSAESARELESARQEAQERIDARNSHELEKAHESSEEKLNEARQEALEKAAQPEKERAKENEANAENTNERRRGPVSKKARKEAFDKTMDEVRTEMSPASRTFSKVLHNPVVERTSEAVGSTVARPNAILSGSLAAFIFTAAIYLIAKHYGYVLSGTETIAAFILGWVVGLIYDYIRVLIFGKEK